MVSLRSQQSPYPLRYHRYRNVVEAGEVAPPAGDVAKHRAGAAGQYVGWYLNDGVAALSPRPETGVGVSGSPDRQYRYATQRRQVHVSRIHAEHSGQLADERQFGRQRELTRHDDDLRKAFAQRFELSDFVGPTPKQEDPYRLVGVKLFQQRPEPVEGPHFLNVLGKRRNAQPRLIGRQVLTFQKSR